MKLKKNDCLDLEIVDITNLGFGVAKIGGEVVFVADTVPGDKIRARIIKSASSYAIGKAEEYIAYSPLRTDKRCSLSCKSCAYKLLSYERENQLKEESVRQVFKKSGLDDVKILPLVPSPDTHGYRNKAQYPIAKNKDGSYAIGFYAPKSHRVTEAADCPLAPSVFSEILGVLREFFAKYSLSVYNEESGEGLLRHIYLRRGEISGEILITIVINGDSLPYSDKLIKNISGAFPAVVGILLNVNKDNTNVILGKRFITLFGRDYIFDTLAGVKLKITAPSFYQVNHGAAELLYAKAKELAKPQKCDLVLDLYCGAGSIGLSMADAAGEIVGIEIVESAVECAKFNAENNGIKNASFYAGDASSAERLLTNAQNVRGEKIKPDIVILDPPRAGTTEELINYISTLNPKRIVYISCNPQTLARDMVIFKARGYVGNEVTPFDLFPATGHVESVTLLRRETNMHDMKLHRAPFEMIRSGEKTIELRLYDEKRQKIKEGDVITFTNTYGGEQIRATVKKLHVFNNFDELYKALPLLQCGYTREDVDSASPSDMEEYYSKEEQNKYGVVGIELCAIDEA